MGWYKNLQAFFTAVFTVIITNIIIDMHKAGSVSRERLYLSSSLTAPRILCDFHLIIITPF